MRDRLVISALLVAGSAPHVVLCGRLAAECGGRFAPTSLIAWVAVALASTELVSAVPLPASPYAWGRVAFGSGWGFVWAWWRLLVAIFSVAVVGQALGDVDVQIGGLATVSGDATVAAMIISLGLITTAWPPVIWPVAVAGAAASLVAGALAPLATLDAYGVLLPQVEMGEGFAIAGVGIFGGILAVLGADTASLVVGEFADARRLITWGGAVGAGLLGLVSFGSVIVEAGGIRPDFGLGPSVPPIAVIALALGLVAQAVIGLGVAARLTGAMARDYYLPKSLALDGNGRPSRHAVVVAVAGASLATFLTPTDNAHALTATWAGSLVMLANALVVVRVAYPELRRGFVIPGGIPAIALCSAVLVVGAASVLLFGVVSDGLRFIVGGVLSLGSGPVTWVALTIIIKRGRPNREVPLETASRWFDTARPGTPELGTPVTADVPFDVRVASLVPMRSPKRAA